MRPHAQPQGGRPELTLQEVQLIHAALETLIRHLEQKADDQQVVMTDQPDTLTGAAAPWRIQEAYRLADQAIGLQERLAQTLDDTSLLDLLDQESTTP